MSPVHSDSYTEYFSITFDQHFSILGIFLEIKVGMLHSNNSGEYLRAKTKVSILNEIKAYSIYYGSNSSHIFSYKAI